jgi:hypothetical protein
MNRIFSASNVATPSLALDYTSRVQSRVCRSFSCFAINSKSPSQCRRVALCETAIVAIRQSAALGETAFLRRRPARLHERSHPSSGIGKRWIGAKRFNNEAALSFDRMPTMSSRIIQSVTATSPLRIRGSSSSRILGLPDERSASTHTEVSTRCTSLPRTRVTLLFEVSQRHIEIK